MPEFTVSASHLDPYKDFRFRIVWDGRAVAGVSHVSPLVHRTEPVEHHQGGDPNDWKAPGRTRYEAITLERGVTHDTGFDAWAAAASSDGAAPRSESLRKEVRIEQYDEAGQMVSAYLVHRCWPSEYASQPALDANADAVAIEHLKLEHEGWALDTSVTEPLEPGA